MKNRSIKDEEKEKEIRFGKMLLDAVEEQLEDPECKEVQREYARLMESGTDEGEVKRLMAAVLSFHVIRSTQNQKEFDYPAYIAELSRLPEIDLDEPL
jgi:hypothetical protein